MCDGSKVLIYKRKLRNLWTHVICEFTIIYIYNLWFVSVKIIIKLAGFLFFPRSFFICVESLPGILSQPTVKQFRFYFFSCLYRKNISFLLPSRHLIFAPWRNILMYIKFVFRINISVVYIISPAVRATIFRRRAGLRPNIR